MAMTRWAIDQKVVRCVLCLGSAMILMGPVRAQESHRPTLLSAASEPLLDQSLYAVPKRLVSGIEPDGAVSVNGRWERGESDRWFIEQQRYGADLVQAGVVRRDATLIKQGLQILDWGFQRQGSDGSFPGTGDPFHSTSFFVEAAARALLLLKEYDPVGYADVIHKEIPRLTSAALWLTKPDVMTVGQRNNSPYTHRRWLLAAALGETGALTKSAALIAAASEYARDGLSLQTEDGIDPEKGGGDVSYQAVGLLFAGRYYLVCDDAELRTSVGKAIRRGLQWESTKVDRDGNVDVEGSTRITTEHGRSGEKKNVDYKNLVQAFVLGSIVTGERSFHEVAEHLVRGRGWTAPSGGKDPV